MPARKSTSKTAAPRRARAKIEVRASGVHGKGVYATASFRKGERIVEYTGKHIPWKIAQDQPARDPADPYHTFLFSLENGDVIDAGQGGNAARWINHSCAPNCETIEEGDRIFVEAIRAIWLGDELFYDYLIVPAERRTKKLQREFACHCGSARCRGTMLGPARRRPKATRKKKR